MGFLSKIFKNTTNLDSSDDFFSGISLATSKYIQIDDKDDILLAYNINPTIRSIVDKKSDLFSKILIQEKNKADEILEDTPFLKVINNPHPFYSQNQFLFSLSKQLTLFGVCYIYVNRSNIGGLLTENDTMLVLPANDIEEIYSENIELKEIKDKSDYLLGYKFYFQGKEIIFETYEIIKIGGTAFESLDIEKIQTLENAVNIISSAYNVRNTLQRRNGGFGILTNDQKTNAQDMFNSDIEKSEIDNLQKEIKKYNFNKNDYNFIITNVALKFQAITYPIKDMALMESVTQARIDICDVLNFPILALNDMSGSTFSNMETADKKIYTDSIIPMWELVQSEFNSALFTLNNIYFDYSHIESLKKNKKTEIETSQINDDLQINRFEKGIITYNEMRVAIGLEELSGGDYYYSQPKITENEN